MADLQKDISDIQVVNDKLVTDNNKVARFAYTDTAYTDDIVDGVSEYNFNNDQNIPLTTAGNLQVSDQFLDKGVRAQASSIPRMFLNGMLGRMSYNLNKAQDFLKTVLSVTQRSLTRDFCMYSSTARYQYLDGCYMSNPLNPTDVSLFTRINLGQTYLVGVPPYKEDGTIDSVNWKETGDPRVPVGLYKKMPQLFSGTFSGVNPINPDTNTADTRWQLCDGTNGTPDLRNRFIRGGTGANQGTLGGSDTQTHTVTVATKNISLSIPTPATAITEAQLRAHGHQIFSSSEDTSENSVNSSTDRVSFRSMAAGDSNYIMRKAASQSIIQNRGVSKTIGSSSSHTHPNTTVNATHNHTAGTGSSNNMPAFYTLAYIMYIGG